VPDLATHTLLVTVSGDDRPGVTSTLFDAIADVGAEVLDLEQVVVRGHLTLALLLAAGPQDTRLRDVVTTVATSLGMHVTVASGSGDNAPRRSGRAAVVRPWSAVAGQRRCRRHHAHRDPRRQHRPDPPALAISGHHGRVRHLRG